MARHVASGGLEGAGWQRRAAVRMHLLMCRHCRAYARQLRALAELMRKLCDEQAPDAARLRLLEESILERMSAGRRRD